MLDPMTAISAIGTVAQQIYKQVKLVKANKDQCKRLAARIAIIEQSVKNLDKIEDKSQYEKGLNELLEGLKNCLNYTQKLSVEGSFTAFIRAGNHNQEHEQLNLALQQSIEQLNLGLSAHHLFNSEQDKADQKADREFIKANFQELISQAHQVSSGIEHLREDTQQARLQLDSTHKHVVDIKNRLDEPSRVSKLTLEQGYLVKRERLELTKRLHENSVGSIWLGTYDGHLRVIKYFNDKQLFRRSVKIMYKCNNENITRFYGASETKESFFLLMEHMEKGSLREVLDKTLLSSTAQLSPETQKQMALDIVSGLQYLHNHAEIIFHRALNSSNVLVNAQDQAKLSNFGLSKIHAPGIETAGKQKTGHEAWIPPEYSEYSVRREYTAKSDVYSYGFILWELFTGKKTYPNMVEIESDSLVAIPEPYAILIKACWQQDPKKRPDAEQIVAYLQSPTNDIALLSSDTSLRKPRAVLQELADFFANQWEELEKDEQTVLDCDMYNEVLEKVTNSFGEEPIDLMYRPRTKEYVLYVNQVLLTQENAAEAITRLIERLDTSISVQPVHLSVLEPADIIGVPERPAENKGDFELKTEPLTTRSAFCVASSTSTALTQSPVLRFADSPPLSPLPLIQNTNSSLEQENPPMPSERQLSPKVATS